MNSGDMQYISLTFTFPQSLSILVGSPHTLSYGNNGLSAIRCVYGI